LYNTELIKHCHSSDLRLRCKEGLLREYLLTYLRRIT